MKRQQQCFKSQLTTHNRYIRPPSQCSRRISWDMAKNMGQQSENLGLVDTYYNIVCIRYHKNTFDNNTGFHHKHTCFHLPNAKCMHFSSHSVCYLYDIKVISGRPVICFISKTDIAQRLQCVNKNSQQE